MDDRLLDGCFSLRGKRSTNARIVMVGLGNPSLTALKKPITSVSLQWAAVVRYVRA
jgi:hypothetical protein